MGRGRGRAGRGLDDRAAVASADAGVLHEDDARTLVDVFQLALELRMGHQMRQLAAGVAARRLDRSRDDQPPHPRPSPRRLPGRRRGPARSPSVRLRRSRIGAAETFASAGQPGGVDPLARSRVVHARPRADRSRPPPRRHHRDRRGPDRRRPHRARRESVHARPQHQTFAARSRSPTSSAWPTWPMPPTSTRRSSRCSG